MESTSNSILAIDRVTVRYDVRTGVRQRRTSFVALNDVSLEVKRGEAFGIVGASGAGKSTLARLVAGFAQPSEGTIALNGKPLSRKRIKEDRSVQMVFQDPNSSLNPKMTIGNMLTELLRAHRLVSSRKEGLLRAGETLESVGIPASALTKTPRMFSGGQRQRIAIARALILEPSLLLADEPVSALDVSVQASILVLLKELQNELGLTILFISHDLAVVHQFCDRIAVMRNGEIVESGSRDALFHQPGHEYTRELLGAATDLPRLQTPPEVARAY